MPNTYVALRTETVAVATNSVTLNLSGISGYTDLRLVARGVSSGGDIDLSFRLNGDTGSNYSRTFLWGSGSTPGSGRSTGLSFGRLNYVAYWTTSNESVITADFMNYSNTTTFKTVLSRDNNSAVGVGANINLWRSTAAITSIEIYTSAFNFAVGTTFSLYGIANADQGAAKATGGIITEDSQYWYHTFGASGAFIPKQSLTCDILQVAGGGSGTGAAYSGGGGGAGGLRYFASQSLTAISYNVTVGAGGTAPAGSVTGADGNNSQFGSLTLSTGGGGGGGGGAAPNNGRAGGSGGGAGATDGTGGAFVAGGAASPSGQGNAGGSNSSITVGPFPAGGGGGASAVGANASSTRGGIGGDGSTAYSQWGLTTSTGQNVSGTVYYAGGGTGSEFFNAGSQRGGYGGGGASAINSSTAGSAGSANTGGGGGGGGSSGTGGNGGSGVVIIRYSK
jgi:hypothetical protein